MERYKMKTILLSQKDIEVMMESLWHSTQRADIPDEDRERAGSLRQRLGDQFEQGEERVDDRPPETP